MSVPVIPTMIGSFLHLHIDYPEPDWSDGWSIDDTDILIGPFVDAT